MTRSKRLSLTPMLAAALCVSCATNRSGLPAGVRLPENAIAHEAIAPLAFLAGRWLSVNKNDTVNEEHWMLPRGRFLLGTFRQIRLDGKCSFVELSQISLADGGEIVLRLRHLHRNLEVPEKRKDANVFRLVALTDRRVEFAGTGDAEGVSSVVYELRGRHELVQTISFDPKKSKEKPFVSVYHRAGD